MIFLDGSQGEGGGQILRSALALSVLTGKPFRIENIRAGRAKPGLLRQHLTALQAAAQISGGKYSDGVGLGVTKLDFYPGTVRGGQYEFAIGSAGSAMLVLQTVLLPLMFADAPSRVIISGGTHNPAAPPYEFMERAFLPVLQKMGADIQLKLIKYGFMPAGGGRIMVEIMPIKKFHVLELLTRGEHALLNIEAFFSNIPFDVAQRELATAGSLLSLAEENLHVREVKSDGPGNALVITLETEFITEVFTAFGQRALRAEDVAAQAAQEVRNYLSSGAVVGEDLADQLLLPMAIAGGGSFVTVTPSLHTTTNADVIRKFLPVDIIFEQERSSETVIIRIKKK